MFAKEVKEKAHVVNGINVDQMRDTIRSIRRDPAKAKETWKATTTWKEGNYVQTRIREFIMEGDERDKLLGWAAHRTSSKRSCTLSARALRPALLITLRQRDHYRLVGS
jgi:hypothetical protein